MLHPGAGAFELGPVSAPRVLLFHGLTGAPSELWPLGVGLARAGYRVEAPVWPGHGTTPSALADVDASAVIDMARRTAKQGRRPVGICGMSFGALVTLCVASEVQPEAVVLIAPAAVMAGRARLFDRLGAVPWPRAARLLVPKGAPDRGEPGAPSALDPVERAAIEAPLGEGVEGRYDRIPLRWSSQLRHARRLAREAAPVVRSPVLIAHGLEDGAASFKSAGEVSSWLTRAPVTVRLFPRSRHAMALGVERGRLAGDVARFLSMNVTSASRPGDAESA